MTTRHGLTKVHEKGWRGLSKTTDCGLIKPATGNYDPNQHNAMNQLPREDAIATPYPRNLGDEMTEWKLAPVEPTPPATAQQGALPVISDRAAVIEECAKICDDWRAGLDNRTMQSEGWAAAECAVAIRALLAHNAGGSDE